MKMNNTRNLISLRKYEHWMNVLNFLEIIMLIFGDGVISATKFLQSSHSRILKKLSQSVLSDAN